MLNRKSKEEPDISIYQVLWIALCMVQLRWPVHSLAHCRFTTRNSHGDPSSIFLENLEYGINIFQETWNRNSVIWDQPLPKKKRLHSGNLNISNFEIWKVRTRLNQLGFCSSCCSFNLGFAKIGSTHTPHIHTILNLNHNEGAFAHVLKSPKLFRDLEEN